ncbi:MAG: ATP-binding protein [Bacteroidales bacterium]
MNTLNILLIEDNPADARLMSEMLKDIIHFKSILTSAETIKEGCELIQKYSFNLILLDLNLPDGTGQQALEKVLCCCKEVPVVLITGNEDEELALKMISRGAQDYNSKQSLSPSILGKSILYSIERKQNENKLKESRLLLKEAQKLAHLGVWSCDPNFDHVTWSEELYQIAGLDPKFPAPSFAEHSTIFTPRSSNLISETVKNALITGEDYKVELELIRPDGTIRNVIAHGRANFNIDGQMTELMGTVQDITEQKKAMENLNRTADRLKILHALDATILASVDSTDKIAEKSLEHLWKLLQSKKASISIFDQVNKQLQVFESDAEGKQIVHETKNMTEEIISYLKKPIQCKIEKIEDILKVNSTSATADIANVKGIQSFLRVPLLSAKELFGIVNIGWENPRTITQEEIDITTEIASQITIALEKASLLKEIRLHASDLEERVTERTAQYEAANKELETFSYSVSHDLRAPLRHINGFISLFLEHNSTQLTEEDLGYLAVVSKSAEDMGALIDALLAFSRLNRLELKKTNNNTLEIIDQGLKLFTEDIRARGIEMKIGPLPETYADLHLIRQVWINLISNAIKYTGKKEKAIIEIGSFVENDKTNFFIKDNGAGFDMKYSKKLFALFQRLHKQKDFGGIGIGLANINRIIMRHGGQCWAEGEKEKGATFYFSLPMEKSA